MEYQVLTKESLVLGVAMLPGNVILREGLIIATAIGIVTAVGTAPALKVCADTITSENVQVWGSVSTDGVGVSFDGIVVNSKHFCRSREKKVRSKTQDKQDTIPPF